MTPAELVAFARARWAGDPHKPGMEDAYKWLFHATQGGEHAITSPDGPRAPPTASSPPPRRAC